jgi:4-amino-4-deoxy-L-arabinose transferase-like glycosyltransferase
VFAAALALRVWHWFEVSRHYPFFRELVGDAASYDAWARRLAAGRWLGDTAFYQDPLYPYLLGVFYRLFGHRPDAARLLQCVGGALAAVLVFETARRVFGRRAAWFAGLLTAGYGLFVFHDAALLKEGLSVLLTAACLLALVLAAERPAALGRWAAAGIGLGLLTLTRGNALLLAPPALAWVAWVYRHEGRRAVLSRAGALAAGLALALIPSVAHNRAAGGDWVLTTHQAGPNFYIGNGARATGTYDPLVPGRHMPEFEGADARALAENALGRALRPSEVSRYWFRRAWADIAARPGRWARLLARKAGLFLQAYEVPDVEDADIVRRFSAALRLPLAGYGLVLPLALLGLWRGARAGPVPALLAGFAAVNALSVALFYVFARYRLPSVPPFLVFAGLAAAGLWESARERRVLKTAGGALFVLTAAWAVNAGTAARRTDFLPTSLANLATHYQGRKEFAPALQSLDEALRLSPQDVNTRFARANVLYDMGRLDEAAAEYEETIRLEPDQTEAMYLLGVLRAQQGRVGEAVPLWEKVLRILPDHAGARQAMELIKRRVTG